MKNAYEINILFYYYIIRFSIIMSNVQVVGNPAETAAALARVTGDYRDNIEMNSVIDQLNTDSNGLKDYNHQLQQHLKSEYYNLLDQNALMDFTKTEKARLTDKIKNLKTKSTYNDRVHLFSYSSNKRIRVYTKLLISLLLVILAVIGVYMIKNKGLLSDTMTSVLIAVVIFVVFMYFFYVLSDLSKRDKFQFDKYNFEVTEDMLKPIDMPKNNKLNTPNLTGCAATTLLGGLNSMVNQNEDGTTTEPAPTNEAEAFAVYN